MYNCSTYIPLRLHNNFDSKYIPQAKNFQMSMEKSMFTSIFIPQYMYLILTSLL